MPLCFLILQNHLFCSCTSVVLQCYPLYNMCRQMYGVVTKCACIKMAFVFLLPPMEADLQRKCCRQLLLHLQLQFISIPTFCTSSRHCPVSCTSSRHCPASCASTCSIPWQSSAPVKPSAKFSSFLTQDSGPDYLAPSDLKNTKKTKNTGARNAL